MHKIYVIDDDIYILDAVRLILESENYQVVTSEDSKILFNINTKNMPDLIILDALLSGEDGREIAKQLKNKETTQKIPIILTSAHPNIEKTYKETVVDDFLAKPFDIEDLLKKVKKNLIS